jgi:hypothetical protein
VPRLPALLLHRTERPREAEDGLAIVPDLPRQRSAERVESRDQLVIRHGEDALRLLDVAPDEVPRWDAGSLLLGFAVGAVLVGRRRG